MPNEELRDQVAGYLLSTWSPRDLTRRLVMLMLTGLALYLSFKQNAAWLLLLLVPASMSPKLVGEIARLLGRAASN
jgi:hypothetical protein